MKFGSYQFEVSHPDKILFPDAGITKQDLIDYYVRIAPHFLPHAEDRPLAMHRFPDGIEEDGFFQKDKPDYFPDWIQSAHVPKREGGAVDMVLANNQATLAYLANQGCITPHLWLSRRSGLEKPDKLLFDLDPPDGAFDLVIRAARLLREVLEEKEGLRAYIMTTGSRGMHVVVPLRTEHNFEEAREKARSICRTLAEEQPDRFTIQTRKDQRGERLFLDYLRNAYGQHSVAPYAVRALPGAPVATPLDWSEIGSLADGARTYHLGNIFRRLGRKEDPWSDMWQHAGSFRT